MTINTEEIVAKLDAFDIKEIAIIDDVYDPPTIDYYTDEIETFLSDVLSDKDANKQLCDICSKEIYSSDDIDDITLSLIYNNLEKVSNLKVYFDNHLLGRVIERRAPLVDIVQNLSSILKRSVKCYGTAVNVEELKQQVVFIDYILGPSQDPNDTDSLKEKAATIVNNIKKFRADSLPIIVLMSFRNPSLDEVEGFRKKTDLLPGIFYFFKKQDISNIDYLILKLLPLSSGWYCSKNIQCFIDSIDKRLGPATNEFLECVKGLGVEDYAYIQKMSLQEDGQPLGDYVLNLFTSYLTSLLLSCDEVLEKQKLLDSTNFESLPPTHGFPTKQLEEFYYNVLFSRTDEKFISEFLDPQDTTKKSFPIINIGDLFYSEDKNDVFTIVNAECDLAFTPFCSSRPYKPDKLIFAVPGKLMAFDKIITEEEKLKPRTDFLRIKDNDGTFRIIWNTNKWFYIECGNIENWMKQNKYKRIARLRLPYAIMVQKAFSEHITRIGTPVRPPIYQKATISVCCEDQQGNTVSVFDSSDSAYVFIDRIGNEMCVFNEDFIAKTKELIEKILEYIENRISEMRTNNRLAGIPKYEGYKTRLNEMKDNYKYMFILRGPISMEGKDAIVLPDIPVRITRKIDMGKSFQGNEPFIIYITR